jgi:hypothetical protein
MKQVFINGQPLQLFFSETSSKDSIIEHITELVMFDERNIFKLNEQHSCCVSPSMHGDLSISGDEDSKTVTIEKIKPLYL